MNKPSSNLEAADGPLDKDGQQIWSAEEQAAITRLHRDPAYWAAIEEAEEDVRAGRVFTQDEIAADAAERRCNFLAARNR
jgi:hypothetical protein